MAISAGLCPQPNLAQPGGMEPRKERGKQQNGCAGQNAQLRRQYHQSILLPSWKVKALSFPSIHNFSSLGASNGSVIRTVCSVLSQGILAHVPAVI